MDSQILQFLVNKSHLAIFVYEVESKQFSFLNSTFETTFPIPAETVAYPEALWKLVHPEDQQYVAEAYQTLLKGKECKPIELRLHLPEQEEKWFCLRTWLITGNTAQQIIGYLEDITTAKQYVDYLQKFGSKKNSILHILAHDLAGPLAMIQALAGEVSRDVQSYKNQGVNELIALIQKTSNHGVSLIKNLLDNEFLETTGVDVVKRRVNIVKRFVEIMDQYQQSAAELAITFRFLSANPEIYVNFDDTKLIQAVNNLISNAIKFTPKGGNITLSLEDAAEMVLIKLEDNGIGIPKKYHATLFDKFTRAGRPGLNGEQSTGLGMSIVKTIVEWHRGHIWFESEENRGTTFYIEIPKE